MLKTNRLRIVWLFLPLLCSCSLDSTPRGGSDSAGRRGPSWTPAGASTSGDQQDQRGVSGSIDGDNPVEPAKNSPATSSKKPDAGSPPNSQNDPAPSSNTNPPPAAQSTPNAPSGGSAAPAAPSGGNQAVDAGNAAAGSGGGTTPADAAAAGGAQAESIRQRFIDAAIEAIGGGTGGNEDGGSEPWRRTGSGAGGLSPDFVLPVLLTMRNSAVCFREVRRCVALCVVLSTDCEPCAADPECAQALKDVCGPALGSCGNP